MTTRHKIERTSEYLEFKRKLNREKVRRSRLRKQGYNIPYLSSGNKHLEFAITPEQRFIDKIDKTSHPKDCWLWIASCIPFGYGQFFYKGKMCRAHRIAFVFWINKNLSDDIDVLHKCDNPPCVNPDHLFTGTQLDNMQDKMLKKRWRNQYTSQKGE